MFVWTIFGSKQQQKYLIANGQKDIPDAMMLSDPKQTSTFKQHHKGDRKEAKKKNTEMKERTVTSRNNYKDMGYHIILTLLNAFCIEGTVPGRGGY